MFYFAFRIVLEWLVINALDGVRLQEVSRIKCF